MPVTSTAKEPGPIQKAASKTVGGTKDAKSKGGVKARPRPSSAGAKAPAAKLKAERKRLQKRKSLHADLLRELAQVRENLSSSAQALVARLDGEIAAILGAFEGEGIPGEPERLPHARAQATMLLAIRKLKVKPAKGRLKDLGRIADLAALLARTMPRGG